MADNRNRKMRKRKTKNNKNKYLKIIATFIGLICVLGIIICLRKLSMNGERDTAQSAAVITEESESDTIEKQVFDVSYINDTDDPFNEDESGVGDRSQNDAISQSALEEIEGGIKRVPTNYTAFTEGSTGVVTYSGRFNGKKLVAGSSYKSIWMTVNTESYIYCAAKAQDSQFCVFSSEDFSKETLKFHVSKSEGFPTVNNPYIASAGDIIFVSAHSANNAGTLYVSTTKKYMLNDEIPMTTQMFNDIEVREYEDLLSQARYSTDENVLTLLHFSDIHGNEAAMKEAINIVDEYEDKIDDVIHTGDTIKTTFSTDMTKWEESGCANRVLNMLGNHDTYLSDDYRLNAVEPEDAYNTLFKPYINDWGVTQPVGINDPNSEDYCGCYYYKDYSEAAIRLIVLDTDRWTNAQLDWMVATLEEAKLLGYAVVVGAHVPIGYQAGKVIGIENCNFNPYTQLEFEIKDRNHTTLDESAAIAIDSFISTGGNFICWLCGHFHCGGFGYIEKHDQQLVLIAEKAGVGTNNGAARIMGETNEYAFNAVTFNPSEKTIKVVRFGSHVDGSMRQRHVFCYDYENKKIISQW